MQLLLGLFVDVKVFEWETKIWLAVRVYLIGTNNENGRLGRLRICF